MYFLTDTVLYHPIEGKRLFPQGEQHPGAAWFATPACKPPEPTAETFKALADSEAQVAILRDELAAANSQITGQARALGEEMEALRCAHADALTEKDARIAQLEADIETLIRQRDAATAGKPVLVHVEAVEPAEPALADADPDAVEKAAIRRELAQLGLTAQPHARTGLPKLREALEAARAEARKAA